MNNIVYVGKHSLTMTVAKHIHSTMEIVYCTGGTGHFVFDDSEISYGEGDIVVIPPLLPHSNYSEEGFTNIHINMANSTFPLQHPLVIHDDSNHFILDAFVAASYHFNSSAENQQILLSPLGYLIHAYLMVYQSSPGFSRIVEEIERNIIDNYNDCNYELDSYLQSLPFSYDYLRKLFKKEIGVTPHKYLIEKRLNAASDMLCYGYCGGTDSVADIALMCGFREPLYFSRMFKKKYGVAPSYYPELIKQQQSEDSHKAESHRIILEK